MYNIEDVVMFFGNQPVTGFCEAEDISIPPPEVQSAQED